MATPHPHPGLLNSQSAIPQDLNVKRDLMTVSRAAAVSMGLTLVNMRPYQGPQHIDEAPLRATLGGGRDFTPCANVELLNSVRRLDSSTRKKIRCRPRREESAKG